MRRGEWAESVPISGIECVGEVESCPGGEFTPGTPVAAMMGGLGRTIPGGYAEYTVVRVGNVVPLGEVGEAGGKGVMGLSWAELAALPESYVTAWTCLFRNLEVERGMTLLIRGATSAFGRAAVNLAVEKGAVVTATTRSEGRVDELRELGANDVVADGGLGLGERLREQGKTERFDRVLELVGNSVVVESLGLVKRGGRLCLAGWLGGLDPIPGPEGEERLRGFNPLCRWLVACILASLGALFVGRRSFRCQMCR